MGNQILQDTTLTAIVRDEEDNPAQGVETWLRATLPYVERAVVVDTGSIDRTREIVEGLKREYSHLEVFYRAFDDFVSSRNFSLGKVRTKRALILDADELLLPEEYGRLNQLISQSSAKVFCFNFKEIYPDGTILDTMWNLQIARLFEVYGASFVNSMGRRGFYESLNLTGQRHGEDLVVPAQVAVIKHFLSSLEAQQAKRALWYGREQFRTESPLTHARAHGWKARNGGRNFYFNSEARLKEYFPRLVETG